MVSSSQQKHHFYITITLLLHSNINAFKMKSSTFKVKIKRDKNKTTKE